MTDSQILTLLNLMYQQLETKKALTYRIKALYYNVKNNYSQYVLEDIDTAVHNKFSKEACDVNV